MSCLFLSAAPAEQLENKHFLFLPVTHICIVYFSSDIWVTFRDYSFYQSFFVSVQFYSFLFQPLPFHSIPFRLCSFLIVSCPINSVPYRISSRLVHSTPLVSESCLISSYLLRFFSFVSIHFCSVRLVSTP